MDSAEQLRDVQNKLNTLLVLLQGNPLDKHDDGLFGEIKKIDERLAKIETWKSKVIWTFVGMCAPASYGIASFITNHFFHLK